MTGCRSRPPRRTPSFARSTPRASSVAIPSGARIAREAAPSGLPIGMEPQHPRAGAPPDLAPVSARRAHAARRRLARRSGRRDVPVPGAATLDVSSGIDWFELHGEVDYDGRTRLAAGAARRRAPRRLASSRSTTARSACCRRSGCASTGRSRGSASARRRSPALQAVAGGAARRAARRPAGGLVRRRRSRAPARSSRPSTASSRPIHRPPFTGTLRGYQREGLGWLLFLQRFGFGGCLADDMGLGKTVQVLALLRGAGARHRRR